MSIKKYFIMISILLFAVFITSLYCESESELIAALKTELEKLTKEDKFSGVVLIARDEWQFPSFSGYSLCYCSTCKYRSTSSG